MRNISQRRIDSFRYLALFVLCLIRSVEMLAAPSEVLALPTFTVTAARSWSDVSALSALDRHWGVDRISKAAPRTVDQLLYQEPSFSFYRRQNALFSAPQTQGVSLRSIGPTAAARSLVLRDGIP